MQIYELLIQINCLTIVKRAFFYKLIFYSINNLGRQLLTPATGKCTEVQSIWINTNNCLTYRYVALPNQVL